MKLITILCVLLAPVMAHAELKIVTTTTDFTDIALQIGRDRLRVH